MIQRGYNFLDKILVLSNEALNTVFSESDASRPNPAKIILEHTLSSEEKKQSAALMRVNHTGEICAQALYQGQLLVASSNIVKQMLSAASQEEKDHLAWTHERIDELKSHRSYLNIFWYSGALMIGIMAGLAGDRISLGFVEETEKQVSRHLQNHLGRLPQQDEKSRKIVEQMRADEEHHGHSAEAAGSAELPLLVKKLMQAHAKVMTSLAYWI